MRLVPSTPERRHSQWRGLVFFCVTLALCVSLASRTVDLKLSDRPTVTSSAQKAKIQHLDKDAFGWSSPVSAFTIFLALAPHTEAMVEENVVSSLEVDTCLYNRPPPVA
jgi:hypothetical protein